MRWIVRIPVFTAALMIGVFTTSFFVAGGSTDLDRSAFLVEKSLETSCRRKVEARRPELLGTWRGSWGYNSGDSSIEIGLVEGNSFSGTLRKEGAEILIQGTFCPVTRELRFNETKVVRLGSEMQVWSLGENRGSISCDGRILYGTGVDKFGQYTWALTR